MASFNRVILAGNITKNIELKTLQSGTSVADIGLAINDRRKAQSGDWVDDVTFVDVTLFGRTAEVANEYLSKGSPILVEGRLRYEAWKSKQGEKRSKLKVIADRMQMLGRKDESQTGEPETIESTSMTF